MVKNLAHFSIAAAWLVACLLNQELGDKAPKKKDAKPRKDICTIPVKICIPSFKKNIEKETPAGSKIRKAAMAALSSAELQKGTFKLTTEKIGDYTLVSEKVAIEPASGTVVVDGMTWKWQITGILGDVEIYRGVPPPFARFEFSPSFTIGSVQDPAMLVEVGNKEIEERWFYIVYGGGPDQDATKRPKSAPSPKKQ